MSMPFVRSPYNYDRDAASNESGIECRDPSLAQQNSKDEADINTIVKRFNLTGELPSGVSVPKYADFDDVVDYHSALNMVIAADHAFMALPAAIRARFDNDAGAFVDFVSDPSNAAAVAEMGLSVGIGKRDLGGSAQQTSQEASPKGAAVDEPAVDEPSPKV